MNVHMHFYSSKSIKLMLTPHCTLRFGRLPPFSSDKILISSGSVPCSFVGHLESVVRRLVAR